MEAITKNILHNSNKNKLQKTISEIRYDTDANFNFILQSMTYFLHDLESLRDIEKLEYSLDLINHAENALSKYKELISFCKNNLDKE